MADDAPKKYQDGSLLWGNIQGIDSSGDRKNLTEILESVLRRSPLWA